ncbi:MAG TPA: hypothetical protein H9724_02700 [Candidatus Gemmiger avistercoris]|uniref:Uncharacterized protein n=2 Tax=Eubacteriales TaxID=186802 RepID=A0A9D2FI40_9FIRM|nr:hypothetical protein [uncultured Subdoligranulum sp.]HIZ61663.1 hypothetical protein [Candidatus Gemmiger avistercoris]
MTRLPRLLWLLGFVLALCFWAAPRAAAAEYDDTLDRLGRLQDLAESYAAEHEGDPILLTLSYTRTGSYNTAIWQLTAGARDSEFEAYVNENDADLAALQGMTTLTLPTGETTDFGHMLASMNLVYNGLPITGSWGGDCMELAKSFHGQADDAAGYAGLMQSAFNTGDSSSSVFSAEDLRADLDSVVVGSQLTRDSDIADTLRSYYDGLTEYDRAYQFIALSFGTVNTSDSGFSDVVYNAIVQDTGMQLLFYMNDMWTGSGWTIDESYAPAVRGATDLLAGYLAGAVNGDRVKSESNNRLVAMGSQALADALNALGDSEAASAALAAAQTGASSTVSSTEAVLSEATQTLQSSFNVKIFELFLLIVAAIAVFFLIMSCALFVSHRRK